MTDGLFARRLHQTLLVFFFCFAVVCGRAVWIGGIDRARYLFTSNQMSVRNILIPARRGAILDKSGNRLVWSERRFDLWSTLPAGQFFSRQQMAELEKIFPGREFVEPESRDVPLAVGLNGNEFAALAPLIRAGFPLRVVPVMHRIKCSRPDVKTSAGCIQNGVGVSGWELKYDVILRGKDGRGQVIVDRRQNWLSGSFKLLEAPVHGKDAVIDPVENGGECK